MIITFLPLQQEHSPISQIVQYYHWLVMPSISSKWACLRGLQSLQKLSLSDNNITDIESYSFSPLTECIQLWLKNNKLTQIRMGMFAGLDSLEALILTKNLIYDIEDGSFANLKQLRRLFLNENELTFLDKNAFEIPFQTNLTLLIERNKLQCNWRTCWIKQGEQEGWISLTLGAYVKPSCLNYPGIHWNQIDVALNCSLPGEFNHFSSSTYQNENGNIFK